MTAARTLQAVPPPAPAPTHMLRLLWPVTDSSMPWWALISEACSDAPALIRRAHADLLGPLRFTLARSVDVPGSGRQTEWVLIGQAPAAPRKLLGHPHDNPREDAGESEREL